jgi:deoxycytidine triphosphate deaminase
MILSGQEIERRATSSLPLIAPFASNSLRRSSYDLTVGNEYYCGDVEGQRSATLQTQPLATRATFSIPAHGVCFILCSEDILLPDNITARVALRMPLIYKGLVLTAQPPFDPGYSGKAIIMVHNLSSRSVDLTQGDRIATIEFSEVTHPTTQSSPHGSVSSLASQLRSPLTGSLTKIDQRVNDANRKVESILYQLGTIIAIVIAIPAIAGAFSYSALSDKISDLKSSLTKSDDVIEQQRKQIVELKEKIERTAASKEQVGVSEKKKRKGATVDTDG